VAPTKGSKQKDAPELGPWMAAAMRVSDAYGSLYETKNFNICLLVWLAGIPLMLIDFANPYDPGPAPPFMTFLQSVYVTLPPVTIMAPGMIELLWLPSERIPKWKIACKKCFIAGCFNIPFASTVMYFMYGKATTREPFSEYGWYDAAQLAMLLFSHDVWFYITHRMNHTEFIYKNTHGHHHKNKGYVYMVNNSDVDTWELVSQGLWGLIFPLFFTSIKMYTHLAALGFFFTYTCTIHSSAMRPNTLHVVHHQYARHAFNYGLYTPMMDTIFGTYKPMMDPVPKVE